MRKVRQTFSQQIRSVKLEANQAVFEWSGSILGLIGAFLLATNSRFSKYGWIFFLLANFAMLAFALSISAWGLLIQQIGFTATSVLGIIRSHQRSSTLFI